jgi:hypothetical protein
MLYENRLVEAPVHEESNLPDELQPVLSSSEYAKCAGVPEHHVEARDKVFWAEVHSTVHRVLHQTRKNRYRLSDAWSQGLPVFLTGGGGSVEGYMRAVRSGGQHCAPVMNLMSLPKHPKLSEFAESISDYQRVSVVCGLAQDAFSLGQIFRLRHRGNQEVEIESLIHGRAGGAYHARKARRWVSCPASALPRKIC